MLDWLSKIDPTVIFVTLSSIVGYFIHARSKDSNASIKDAVLGALRAEASNLLLQYGTGAMEKARAILESAATSLLARMAIKRVGLVDTLVHAGIETVLAELADRVHQLETSLDPSSLADGAQKVLDAFTPPARPTVPRLDLSLEAVEPAEPDPLPPPPPPPAPTP